MYVVINMKWYGLVYQFEINCCINGKELNIIGKFI